MRVALIAAAAALAAIAAWFLIAGGDDADRASGDASGGIAAVMRLTETEAEGDLAEQSAYEALFAALPEGAVATVDAYTEEDGGVVARGVTVQAGGEGSIGLRADEMRAYDLAPDAIDVLSSGTDEEAALASRIDLRGLTILGLGEMTTAISDEMSASMEDSGTSIEQTFDQYDVAMSRLVADGVTLFGSDVVIEDADDKAALRRYARLMRSYAVERAVATGVTMDLAFSQEVTVDAAGAAVVSAEEDAVMGPPGMGEEGPDGMADASQAAPMVQSTSGSGTFAIERSGFSGYARGDMALSFAEGMTGSFKVTEPETQTEIGYDLSAARSTHEGVRIADVLGYALAGEVPPSDETDLLSLGVMRLSDMTMSMMGAPIQQIDSYEIDMAEWHGLLPKRIAYASEETLFVEGLLAMMDEAGKAGGDTPEAEAARQQMAAIAQIVRDADLTEIASTNAVSYDWGPDDGVTAVRMSSVSEGLGSFKLDADAILPAYDGFAAIDAATLGDDDSPLATLMAETSAIDRLVLTLDDSGGIDSVLAAVIAFANLPENDGNPQMAMLRGQDVEALRVMLSATLSMGASQLAAIAPEAQGMATTAAAWLREGGTLTVTLDPETPMTMAQMQGLMAMPGGPSAAIEAVGLSVEREGDAE